MNWDRTIFNVSRYFPSKDRPMIEEQLNYSQSQAQIMIVGLGNPGAEYEGTRHNVGFELLARLAQRHKISLSVRKFQSVYGIGVIEGKQVILMKPMTYMNRSGHAVSQLANSFQIPSTNILVIADDMDLPVGKIRFRSKGSAGGHNGHRSIIASLKTENYPRLRVGIGKPLGQPVQDFVLSKFAFKEHDEMDSAIDLGIEGCELFVNKGIIETMNKCNS